MRKVAVACCAFVVLTLSTLAAGADKTVMDKDHGFEITFPQAWVVIEKPDGSVAQGVSNVPATAKAGAVVSVTVVQLEKGATLLKFVDSEIAGLNVNKILKNYKFVERSESKLGDVNAYKCAFQWDSAVGNVRSQCLAYILLAGTRGFRITATAYYDDFELYAKDIDAIVKSFKLIEEK